ncbi:hypothetical protein B0H16DRAFT_1719621 [Mycena metata]|uniref:Uncharacterized protein n=1 Tax=Mycena metata TaxID=1033252 RepID=A0AAD7JCC5_9AGAR|nr:hypothetical protein B0H16DRAFT_1719621 [Mycena metata]
MLTRQLSVTLFSDPIQRIRDKEAPGVPFMIGNTEDAASFGTAVTPAPVRALYPSGLSDNEVIADVVKDLILLRLCPPELWSAAGVGAGQPDVSVGASFTDMPPFIGAGSWHSSASDLAH